MFSGLFLAILNLFRAVSFLMLQFHVSSLKVHVHFQESQAISGISSLKLFLDFLSLHTFVVIFFLVLWYYGLYVIFICFPFTNKML